MANQQRLSYQSWVQTLKKIQRPDQLPIGAICFGSSSYLLLKTQEKFMRLAEKNGLQIERYEAASLDESSFIELIEQDSLFADKKFIIISSFQANPKLLPYSETVFERLNQNTRLLLTVPQDKLAARIQKTIPTHFEQIPCFSPTARELPGLIQDLARLHKLHLDSEATQVLADSLGTDPFKIENEIKNLALLFPNSKEFTLSANEISRALGSLREDHGFRLEEFILAKQSGKALNLLDDLLKRGESPLAILGILANHCRKALDVFAAKNSGPGSQNRRQLPAFIQQKFLRSLKNDDRHRYLKALRLCHEADIMLKTSKVSDHVPLSEIIMTLTGYKK